MTSIRCKRPSSSFAEALCAAVAMAALSLPAIATAEVNLEGTWKITQSQDAFKPEGGSVPFTAEGRKRYQQNKALLAKRAFDDYDYATARCASPGLPRLMITPERFRIWQRNGWALFQFEWNRQFRQIEMPGLLQPQRRIDGSSILAGDDDAAVGRSTPTSKGHWEGDTLVLTTDGFADHTLIDNLVPHGYDLKTTERIRLVNANTLEDRITIEDPEFFTKPWETVVTYQRQADTEFPENICLDHLFASRPQPNPSAVNAYEVAAAKAAAAQPKESAPAKPEAATDDGRFGPPPLPANAPQPAADPRNFDGTWYHENRLVFLIPSDMFGSKKPFNALGQKVAERRLNSFKVGTPFINASAQCLPPGQFWQFDLNMPFHIFQSKDRFDFVFEEYHGLWQVLLGAPKPMPDAYMGNSFAHWDGDTLVVETSGYKLGPWLDSRGTPASKNAKLTMRIRKVKSENWYLEVIYTLDDPTYYTRPWSWARDYTWRPDLTLFREYDCELQTGAKNGLDASLVPEPKD